MRAEKSVAIRDKFYVSGICTNNTEAKERCSMDDGDVNTRGFPLSAFSLLCQQAQSVVAGECYYHVRVNRVAR
jgi:hypothetical protein